jgi:hypothetical protein
MLRRAELLECCFQRLDGPPGIRPLQRSDAEVFVTANNADAADFAAVWELGAVSECGEL